MFRNRLVQVGGFLVVLLTLSGLAAPLLTRYHVLREPLHQDPAGLDAYGLPRLPGSDYLLGTDNLGRDVLSRVIYGTRVSLTIGTAAMLTATVIGVTVGLISGFYGGKMDLLLMRFTEMNMAIPAILLAIAFAGNQAPFYIAAALFAIAALSVWRVRTRLRAGERGRD